MFLWFIMFKDAEFLDFHKGIPSGFLYQILTIT